MVSSFLLQDDTSVSTSNPMIKISGLYLMCKIVYVLHLELCGSVAKELI